MNTETDNRSIHTFNATIPEHLRVNLHVHSAFSDGQYIPQTLAVQAIERHVRVLGITDHYETRKTLSIRAELLPQYIDTLEQISADYHDHLRILKGLEINTLEICVHGRALPNTDQLQRLDYVVLEYVTNIPRAGVPLKHAIMLAREIPVPVGLAHTDLAMAFPGVPPEELVGMFSDAGIFLELNDAYHRPGERFPFYYHYAPYFEAARQLRLRFSAGMDAHGPITGFCGRAMTLLMKNGLENALFYV
ncbi:PHP domain-containing protein [bacterium]|nr:PHP domain-containing protein [candidate division CSSED10-310 bacterium]